jgi:hypothetical protein
MKECFHFQVLVFKGSTKTKKLATAISKITEETNFKIIDSTKPKIEELVRSSSCR